MERNIARLKPTLNMVHWNEDGFKTGNRLFLVVLPKLTLLFDQVSAKRLLSINRTAC